MARRKQLLQGAGAFGSIPAAVLDELAESLCEEHFLVGATVVAEGERGDRLYLIESGRAEVSTPGATNTVTLAQLDPGDMFGEIALLAPSRKRQATVTALTPLLTLSLSSPAFEKALAQCPEARIDFAAVADTLLTAKFLKQQGSWRR
jgi:CRP/FNR family transcriptional regulator, cyclic AMP receptor protein